MLGRAGTSRFSRLIRRTKLPADEKDARRQIRRPARCEGESVGKLARLGFGSALATLLVGGAGLPAFALDAATAEIDGVKLHMSGDETIAALRQRFGQDIALQVTHFANKFDSTHDLVQSIEYDIEGKYALTIRFSPSVPYDDHRPEAAVAVILVLRRGSDADQQALFQSIKSKYGEESGPGWCSYDDRGPCAKILHESTDLDRGIELIDPGYERRAKAQAEQSSEEKAPL
jgi:hypothetical protein